MLLKAHKIVKSWELTPWNLHISWFEIQWFTILCTAYCIWSVISSMSNVNRDSSSLGLFCHGPLKRDQGDWDWTLKLNHTPNAIGCIFLNHEILYNKIWRFNGVRSSDLIYFIVISPRNGEITLWPNTRVVKYKHCVSHKRNEANDKIQWYNILLTFTF